MKYRVSLLVSLLLLSSSASALEWGMSTGVQDFVVQDIVNDDPNDGISAGDSHTLGVSIGMYLNHTNKYGVDFFARGEAFVDYDTDHLDPDHIPIWFKFAVGANGSMIKLNENSSFKWYVVLDNKQNTVSCIEREIHQYYGLGYELQSGGFTLDLNAYLGFYYIELDDDTPVNRGYTRAQTDDGEASHLLEATISYEFNKSWFIKGTFKNYRANAKSQKLESDYIALLSYKSDWWGQGSSLNLNVEYNNYDFSRFTLYNADTLGRPIVPFDNDMLIQAYIKIPFSN
jgi:hypothetical protein